MHHNTTGIVRAEQQTSEEFPINVGVKQGDVLAPVLFNLVLDAVTRVPMNKHPDKGVSLVYCDDAPILFKYRHKLKQKIMIQSLAYADDIVLVSSNLDDLNCLVETVNQTFNNFGIQLNLAKTKYMHMTPESSQSMTHQTPMNVELVNSFKYLGSILSNNSSIEEDINNRLSKASKVFRGLSRLIWHKKSIRLGSKIKLFRSIILSILLYGSETVSSQFSNTASLGICNKVPQNNHRNILVAKSEKYRAEKNDKYRANRSFDKTKKTPMAWTFAKNGEQQNSEKTAVSSNARR